MDVTGPVGVGKIAEVTDWSLWALSEEEVLPSRMGFRGENTADHVTCSFRDNGR